MIEYNLDQQKKKSGKIKRKKNKNRYVVIIKREINNGWIHDAFDLNLSTYSKEKKTTKVFHSEWISPGYENVGRKRCLFPCRAPAAREHFFFSFSFISLLSYLFMFAFFAFKYIMFRSIILFLRELNYIY